MSRKDIDALNKSIQDLAGTVPKITEAMSDLMDKASGLSRPLKSIEKQTFEWVEDLRDAVHEHDRVIDKLHAVNSAMKTIGRSSILPEVITNGQATKRLLDMTKAMEGLKEKFEEGSKESKVMQEHIDSLKGSMEKLGNASKDALVDPDVVEEINRGILAVARSAKTAADEINDIDFDRPTKASHGFKAEMAGLFLAIHGGSLESVKGITQIAKQFIGLKAHSRALAKEVAGDFRAIGKAARKAGLDKSTQKGLTNYYKSLASGNKEDIKANASVFSTITKDQKNSFFKEVSSDKLISSRIDRWANNRVAKRAQAGLDPGILGKVVGAAGGEDVASGAMMAVAANPIALAIAAALASVMGATQLNSMRNQDTWEAAGKGGFLAGNVDSRSMYTRLRDSLTFGMGSEPRLFNASFKNASEVWGQLANYGFSTGLNSKTKNKDIWDGSPVKDFHTGIMRNAFVYGGTLGMSPKEGADLTLRLITEFNMSMKESEDFFLKMDSTVKAAGISVTSYLNIIDSISGQFDTLNKSLKQTSDILMAITKNGVYSAESLKGMVGGLIGGPKTLTQRAYAFELMGKEGASNLTTAEGVMRDNKLRELERTLGLNRGSLAGKSDEYISAILRGKAKDIEGKKSGAMQSQDLQVAQKQFDEYKVHNRAYHAYSSGANSVGLASASEFSDDMSTKVAMNMTFLDKILKKTGGGYGSLLDSGKMGSLIANPMFSTLMSTLGLNGKDTVNYLPAALSQLVNGSLGGIKVGKGTPGYMTENTARGIKAELDKDKKAITAENVLNSVSGAKWLRNLPTESKQTLASNLAKTLQEKAEADRQQREGPIDWLKKFLTSVFDTLLKGVEKISNLLSFHFLWDGKNALEEGRKIFNPTVDADGGEHSAIVDNAEKVEKNLEGRKDITSVKKRQEAEFLKYLFKHRDRLKDEPGLLKYLKMAKEDLGGGKQIDWNLGGVAGSNDENALFQYIGKYFKEAPAAAPPPPAAPASTSQTAPSKPATVQYNTTINHGTASLQNTTRVGTYSFNTEQPGGTSTYTFANILSGTSHEQ